MASRAAWRRDLDTAPVTFKAYPVSPVASVTEQARQLTHITAEQNGWHEAICRRVRVESLLIDGELAVEPYHASCPQCRSRWARIGMGDVPKPQPAEGK